MPVFESETVRNPTRPAGDLESHLEHAPSDQSVSTVVSAPPRRTCCQFCNYLLKRMQLKERTFAEFKYLLYMTLLFNTGALVAEILNLALYPNGASITGLSICAIVFTCCNLFTLVKLIVSPTTRAALLSCGLIILLEVFYVAQSALFFATYQSYYNNPEAAVLPMFFFGTSIIFQGVTALILYRFWEFVMFNYDGEQESVSDLSDLRGSLAT